MQTYHLAPHPDHPPLKVKSVAAQVNESDTNWLRIRWRVEGTTQVVVPPFAGKGRADGLWQTTCFELFVKPEGEEGYYEWNLSPSERWNAYRFDNYRIGMAESPSPRDPGCTLRQAAGVILFDAAIPRAALPEVRAAIGISAVIEEAAGHKSYWALAHPAGKADFHAAACFAAVLAAPMHA